MGIKTNPSTTHHPQTDGQTKCINQEIETFLQIFINHCQDDWVEWIPIVEFAYNNHVHSSTLHTPFQLDSGQHLCMGTEPLYSLMVKAADEFAKHMTTMQTEAKATLHHAADKMSKYHNQHCQHAPKYSEGDCKDQFPLQVRLSIRSGLGLSLQAGPSVTGSLRSDVTRFGDIQDEKGLYTRREVM